MSAVAPLLYSELTGGAPSLPVPAVRFTSEPTLAAAKAAFAASDPRVRVLFDNGGGSLGPGALQPTYSAGFSSWPPAGSVTRYSLGPDGSLSTVGAGPFLDGVVPAQPGRPAGRRPVVVGQRLGRPAALRLDAGPGRQRHRLPDAGLQPRTPPSWGTPAST